MAFDVKSEYNKRKKTEEEKTGFDVKAGYKKKQQVGDKKLNEIITEIASDPDSYKPVASRVETEEPVETVDTHETKATDTDLTEINPEGYTAKDRTKSFLKSRWDNFINNVAKSIAAEDYSDAAPGTAEIIQHGKEELQTQTEESAEQYREISEAVDAEEEDERQKYLAETYQKVQSEMGDYDYLEGHDERRFSEGTTQPSYDSTYSSMTSAANSFSNLTDSYNFMTEDEKKVYWYLVDNNQYDEATQFKNYLKKDTNKRYMEYVTEIATEFAEENPVLATAASIPINQASGLGTLDMAASIITGTGIDENSPLYTFTKAASTIRENVGQQLVEDNPDFELLGQDANFYYQTGMSICDNVANMLVAAAVGLGGDATGIREALSASEPITLAIMSTGAASQAILDGKERGLGDEEIIATSIIAGLAEWATEKVSLETLLGDPQHVITYLLKNFVAEGSEEIASDLINRVADDIVACDKSEARQFVADYMKDNPNATESEAVGAYFEQFAMQLYSSGLGGALSGLILGSGGVVTNTIQYTSTGAALNEGTANDRINTAQGLIDNAIASGNESLYNMGREMQGKIRADGSLSNYNTGKLFTTANSVQAEAEQKVSKYSKFFGENGAKELLDNYDLSQDADKYASDAREVYARAQKNYKETGSKDFVEGERGILTEAQEKIIYNAAMMDALEGEANGKQGDVSLRDSSQRNDGENSVESVGGVAEDAGSVQERNGETAQNDVGGYGVLQESDAKVTGASLKIQNGSYHGNARLATQLTAEQQATVEDGKKYGLDVVYFTNDFIYTDETAADGTINTYKNRGLYDPKTNKVYVRGDHYLGTKIYQHEKCHYLVDGWTKGSPRNGDAYLEATTKLNEKITKTAAEQGATYDEAYEAMLNKYAETYGFKGELTAEARNYVYEEMLCDAYAGIEEKRSFFEEAKAETKSEVKTEQKAETKTDSTAKTQTETEQKTKSQTEAEVNKDDWQTFLDNFRNSNSDGTKYSRKTATEELNDFSDKLKELYNWSNEEKQMETKTSIYWKPAHSAEEVFDKFLEFYKNYQDGVADENTFFKDTMAEFDAVKRRPKGEPDFTSISRGKVSSEYWYTEEGVIRGSNHWGNGIRSCDWRLEGVRLTTDSVTQTNKLYGFCKWEDFVYKTYVKNAKQDAKGKYSDYSEAYLATFKTEQETESKTRFSREDVELSEDGNITKQSANDFVDAVYTWEQIKDELKEKWNEIRGFEKHVFNSNVAEFKKRLFDGNYASVVETLAEQTKYSEDIIWSILSTYLTQRTGLASTDGKTYVRVHELSVDNLRKALKHYGFAAPSVGIVDIDKPTTKFGEVSVIFPGEYFYPEDVPTFAGDAYSSSLPPITLFTDKDQMYQDFEDGLVKGLSKEEFDEFVNEIDDYNFIENESQRTASHARDYSYSNVSKLANELPADYMGKLFKAQTEYEAYKEFSEAFAKKYFTKEYFMRENTGNDTMYIRDELFKPFTIETAAQEMSAYGDDDFKFSNGNRIETEGNLKSIGNRTKLRLDKNFFEQKPQRAVYIDDASYFVLPSTTSQDVLDMLDDSFAKYVLYDASGEYEQRDKNQVGAIKKLAEENSGIRFSRELDTEYLELSADAVTYDDNGNVIPLSERFNTEDNDIRYSREIMDPVQRKLSEENFYLRNDLAQMETKLQKQAERLEKWKKEAKVYNPFTIDETKVRDYIKKEWSDYYGVDFGDNIDETIDIARRISLLRKQLSQKRITQEQFEKGVKQYAPQVHDIGERLAKNAVVQVFDTNLEADARTIRNQLKRKRMYLLDNMRGDFQDMVKPRGSKLQINGLDIRFVPDDSTGRSCSRQSVDKAYQDMIYLLAQTEFKGMLDVNATNEADEVHILCDLLTISGDISYGLKGSMEYQTVVEQFSINLMDSLINGELEAFSLADKARVGGEMGMGRTMSKQVDKINERFESYKEFAEERINELKRYGREKNRQTAQYWKDLMFLEKTRENTANILQKARKIRARLASTKVSPNTVLAKEYAHILFESMDFIVSHDTGKQTKVSIDEFVKWAKDKSKDETNPFVIDQKVFDGIEGIEKYDEQGIAESSYMMTYLANFICTVDHELRTMSQFLNSKVGEDIGVAGEQFIDLIEHKAPSAGKVSRWLCENAASPYCVINMVTGYSENAAFRVLFDEVVDGQTKQLTFKKGASEMFARWLNDDKFMARITGEKASVVTVMDINGENVKITPAMRISLYLSSLNEDNMRHISQGGATIPDVELYKKGKVAEAFDNRETHRFTVETLQQLRDDMDVTERDFTDMIAMYFNEFSKDELNAVTLANKGYERATVENYFPIAVDKDFLSSDFETLIADGTLEGWGGLEQRKASKKPIYIFGVDSVLQKHIDATAKYVGLSIPVRNISKLFNFNVVAEGGNMSVKKSMGKKFSGTVDYIAKLLADIQNPNKGKSDDVSKILTTLRSNYIAAVLNMNLGVAMKQAASYPTAGYLIDSDCLMRGLRHKLVSLDIINKYTPLLWYRSLGYSEAEIGDQVKPGKVEQATNIISKVDVWTVQKLWGCCELQIDKQGTYEQGTDAYYKAVAELFNRVVYLTQPNYTPMQRGGILRSDSDMTRGIVGVFKTQQFQNVSILVDAIGNYKANHTEEAKKKMVRAISSQIVAGITYSAMTVLWNALRGKYDDDPNKAWKQFITTFISSGAGMIPFGNEIASLIGFFADTILVAIGEDKFFESYSSGLSYDMLNGIGDTITDFTSIVKKMINGDKGIQDDVVNVVGKVFDCFGIPGTNIKNLAQMVMSFLNKLINGWS